jgi:hypothetical protein
MKNANLELQILEQRRHENMKLEPLKLGNIGRGMKTQTWKLQNLEIRRHDVGTFES